MKFRNPMQPFTFVIIPCPDPLIGSKRRIYDKKIRKKAGTEGKKAVFSVPGKGSNNKIKLPDTKKA